MGEVSGFVPAKQSFDDHFLVVETPQLTGDDGREQWLLGQRTVAPPRRQLRILRQLLRLLLCLDKLSTRWDRAPVTTHLCAALLLLTDQHNTGEAVTAELR